MLLLYTIPSSPQADGLAAESAPRRFQTLLGNVSTLADALEAAGHTDDAEQLRRLMQSDVSVVRLVEKIAQQPVIEAALQEQAADVLEEAKEVEGMIWRLTFCLHCGKGLPLASTADRTRIGHARGCMWMQTATGERKEAEAAAAAAREPEEERDEIRWLCPGQLEPVASPEHQTKPRRPNLQVLQTLWREVRALSRLAIGFPSRLRVGPRATRGPLQGEVGERAARLRCQQLGRRWRRHPALDAERLRLRTWPSA